MLLHLQTNKVIKVCKIPRNTQIMEFINLIKLNLIIIQKEIIEILYKYIFKYFFYYSIL